MTKTPPVYIVDVSKTEDRQVYITFRVRITRFGHEPEELRVGRCYVQERLWQEALAPLLWAIGWLIRKPDGSTLPPPP